MESGFRTPLLDFFRRGEVARDVRLLAAQGVLAPRAYEQLGLLALLTGDADPEIASAANATLTRIPPESLSAFLARSDVGDDLRGFFAARGVRPSEIPASDADAPLVETAPDAAVAPDVAAADAPADAVSEDDAERLPTVQRIAAMSVVERIHAAMKGTREERSVLIRDPNKIVAVAVLSSPKVSENEVETFARMANVAEDVLRIIASTRAWMKNYGVALGLVRNPKTPLAISMNLLSRLVERDVRMVSTDRNVPEVLRLAARKKMVITDKR